MVNPVGPSDNRPLTEVLISGVNITVLPDSGATVSAMDEATFRRSGLKKRVKVKKTKCQIKPYGAYTETKTLPVLGSFEALTESKTRMKLVTWQLIKGDTQTPPLLGYTDGKDLGIIRVTNAIAATEDQQVPVTNMEKEIQHLLDQDIIQKVDEPTGWVSSPPPLSPPPFPPPWSHVTRISK